MKQTAFVAVTTLAGLLSSSLLHSGGGVEESPRLQRQGNRPPEGRGPDPLIENESQCTITNHPVTKVVEVQ